MSRNRRGYLPQISPEAPTANWSFGSAPHLRPKVATGMWSRSSMEKGLVEGSIYRTPGFFYPQMPRFLVDFPIKNTSSGHLWVARSTSPRSAKTATWTKALAHITCGLGGAHGPSWSSWPSSSHQLGGDGHLLWQVWSPDRAAIWCMLLKCLVYLCSWWGWTMSNTLEPNQPKPLHLTLSVLSWSLSEMYKICEEIYPWILVICRTDSCATLGSPPRWPPFPELDGVDIPSGNLTVCYWKWWFIVDFPIEKTVIFPLLC